MRNRLVTHQVDAVFRALADPTRRAVLDRLRDCQEPAGLIAGASPVSRPAISRHIRVLLRANLVRERRRGRQRIYELNPRPLKAVDRWLDDYRVFWERKLANLKTFIESEEM